jgi:hypothetical protein
MSCALEISNARFFWFLKACSNEGLIDESALKSCVGFLVNTDSHTYSDFEDNTKVILSDFKRFCSLHGFCNDALSISGGGGSGTGTGGQKKEKGKSKSSKSNKPVVVAEEKVEVVVVNEVVEEKVDVVEEVAVVVEEVEEVVDDDPFSQPRFGLDLQVSAATPDSNFIRSLSQSNIDCSDIDDDIDDDDDDDSVLELDGFTVEQNDEPSTVLSHELVEDSYDDNTSLITPYDPVIPIEDVIQVNQEKVVKEKVVKEKVVKEKVVKEKVVKEKVVKEKVVKEKVVKEKVEKGEKGEKVEKGEKGEKVEKVEKVEKGEKGEKGGGGVKKEVVVSDETRTAFSDWFFAHFHKHSDITFVDKSFTASIIAKRFFADSNIKITVDASRLLLSILIGFRNKDDKKNSTGVFDSAGSSFIQGWASS